MTFESPKPTNYIESDAARRDRRWVEQEMGPIPPGDGPIGAALILQEATALWLIIKDKLSHQ